MGSLERRLRALEGGQGQPCEACGAGYEPVEWGEPDQDPGPERCPECDRRLVHIITWHDEVRLWGA